MPDRRLNRTNHVPSATLKPTVLGFEVCNVYCRLAIEPRSRAYGRVVAAKPTNDPSQEIHIGQIEIVGRLVQQQKLWLLRAREPACECGPQSLPWQLRVVTGITPLRLNIAPN